LSPRRERERKRERKREREREREGERERETRIHVSLMRVSSFLSPSRNEDTRIFLF